MHQNWGWITAWYCTHVNSKGMIPACFKHTRWCSIQKQDEVWANERSGDSSKSTYHWSKIMVMLRRINSQTFAWMKDLWKHLNFQSMHRHPNDYHIAPSHALLGMHVITVWPSGHHAHKFRGCYKNAQELLNPRALKFSSVNKICIFQCMGKISFKILHHASTRPSMA